ncbi:MAG: NTP transferase domain-containing protein, partial [Candidatus Aenigmarchaeota archaeon]|nr:NTP transferase domain-containing protein [Candidatus Aenigmarchaeota archaeon]
MKAVILCAGKSTRTYPLTVNRPKSLLRIGDKTIIEHLLDRLEGIAEEAILVVSDGKIKERIGEKRGNIEIKYARQKEALGTGNALLQAEKFVGKDEKFLVMMGDNLYPRDAVKECVSYGISMLGQKVANPEGHGIVETDKGFLTRIT